MTGRSRHAWLHDVKTFAAGGACGVLAGALAVSLLVYIFVLKNKSSNWLDDEAGMRSRVRGASAARAGEVADTASARA